MMTLDDFEARGYSECCRPIDDVLLASQSMILFDDFGGISLFCSNQKMTSSMNYPLGLAPGTTSS